MIELIRTPEITIDRKIKIGKLAQELIQNQGLQETNTISEVIYELNKCNPNIANRLLTQLTCVNAHEMQQWLKELSKKDQDTKEEAVVKLTLLTTAARAGMMALHASLIESLMDNLHAQKAAETN